MPDKKKVARKSLLQVKLKINYFLISKCCKIPVFAFSEDSI